MCQLPLNCLEKISKCEYDGIIITYGKPHKPASSDTISRSIKDEFGKTGMNTNVQTAHNCRATSASKAKGNGVSITEILKRGSGKEKTLFQHFILEIL